MTAIEDPPRSPEAEPVEGGSTFRYVAEGLDGEQVRGQIVAYSANSARNRLAVEGLRVVKLTERRGLRIEITKQRVPLVEVMHFCRQMGTFLRAGVPITEAIDELRLDAKNNRFRSILGDVLDQVSAGRSLAEALTPHEDIFPTYFMAILRSSELTGRMDDAFDQIQRYIARDLALTRQVRKAMIYPLILLGLSVAVCLIIVVFAIPRFAVFFKDFGAELPLPTRMLMGVADFVQSGAGLISAAVVTGTIVGLALWVRTRRGRRALHGFQLRLPIISTVVVYSSTERFTRVLGVLLDAGVPLPEALPTAIECANNTVFRERLSSVVDGILAGEGFADPLAQTQLFPRTVVQMIRVGERTGALSEQLGKAAGFYEEELTYAIDKLTAWFEPMTIIFIGLVVGFVALAMVSAMYGIYNQVDV